MKTEDIELTPTEIKLLYHLVAEHIDSGIYWGDRKQFLSMQQNLFDKLDEAWSVIEAND